MRRIKAIRSISVALAAVMTGVLAAVVPGAPAAAANRNYLCDDGLYRFHVLVKWTVSGQRMSINEVVLNAAYNDNDIRVGREIPFRGATLARHFTNDGFYQRHVTDAINQMEVRFFWPPRYRVATASKPVFIDSVAEFRDAQGWPYVTDMCRIGLYT